MSDRSEIMSHGIGPLTDYAYQKPKGYNQQLLRKVLRKSVPDAGEVRHKTKCEPMYRQTLRVQAIKKAYIKIAKKMYIIVRSAKGLWG